MARFNADGTVDGGFGDGWGYATNDGGPGAIFGMALEPDGSVIAAGVAGDLANLSDASNTPELARLTAGDVGGEQVRVDPNGVWHALPLIVSGAPTVAAGEPYTLTLGSPLPSGEGAGEGNELGSGTDVSYTVNWGDGTDPTTITADDLAAAGNQVTHTFATSSTGITVDLTVDGTPYTDIGSLALNVTLTDATATSLSVSNSSLGFGNTVTLAATVAADTPGVGTPSGTVEFYDNVNGETIDFGPGTLDDTGTAMLTTPPLPAGTHDFTAVYSGDDTFVPSTSAAASATVGAATGTVYLSADSTSVAEGTQYSLDLPTIAGGYSITGWSFNWATVRAGPRKRRTLSAPGNYTIAAIAVNSQGNGYNATLSTGAAATVDVTQAAPTITSVTVDNSQYSGADTEEGGSIAPDQLHASFTGPASAESYNLSINWGDGAEEQYAEPRNET